MSSTSTSQWRLTPAQLAVLWNDLGLADYPYPLEIAGIAGVEPGRIAEELAAADLLEDGQPRPALDDALRLIAEPLVWIDSIWLADEHTDSPWRVVGVRGEQDGVLVTQLPGARVDLGGDLSMRIISSARMTEEIVEALPPERPGEHPPVTVAAADVVAGAVTPTHPISKLLACRHTRLGQLAANLRTGATAHRSPVIRWFDRPDDGRYVIVPTRPGGETITVTPADPIVLATAIDREIRLLSAS